MAGEAQLQPYVKYYIEQAEQKFGLTLSSGYRPGAVTEFGTKSLHGMRLAGDLSGTPSAMAQAYQWSKTLPNIKEVIYNGKIYTPSGGERHYTGANQHTDHVHLGFDSVVNGMIASGVPSTASGNLTDSIVNGLITPLAGNLFTVLSYLMVGVIILVSLYKVFEPEAKRLTHSTLKAGQFIATKGAL